MSRFIPAVTPPTVLTSPCWWFVFCADQWLIQRSATGAIQVPNWPEFSHSGLQPQCQHYLGLFNTIHCFAIEIGNNQPLPDGLKLTSLRAVMPGLSDELFALASRAKQIITWDKNHQFCSRCSALLQLHAHERVKYCPECDLGQYPRLNPAIIVLISRGKQLLLSRSPHFPPGVYSVQAGFVEVGETLEEALHREVREEVGLSVKNIRYFGSQAWPFPHTLMIAFTAEYASGELCIDTTELEAAHWYALDQLPPLATSKSIARRMIEDFLAQHFA